MSWDLVVDTDPDGTQAMRTDYFRWIVASLEKDAHVESIEVQTLPGTEGLPSWRPDGRHRLQVRFRPGHTQPENIQLQHLDKLMGGPSRLSRVRLVFEGSVLVLDQGSVPPAP